MSDSPHERNVHAVYSYLDFARCKPRNPALCKSYAFGDNCTSAMIITNLLAFLQLGVGDCIDRHLPVRAIFTEKFNVIDVAVGAYHTLLLTG